MWRTFGLLGSSRRFQRVASSSQQSEVSGKLQKNIFYKNKTNILCINYRINYVKWKLPPALNHSYAIYNTINLPGFDLCCRYLRLLGRFHALTLLKLDYPALSNHALNALATSKTLKSLYISVRDSDSRQHMVADAAWHNLVLACPDLKVSYTIGITECCYTLSVIYISFYFQDFAALWFSYIKWSIERN